MRFFPRVIDGGTGTELERSGVPMNSMAWSAQAIITHPEALLRVHRSFLEAGAQLLIANSFSAAMHNMQTAGLADHFVQVNTDAVRIMKQAIGEHSDSCLAAGAISTTTFSGALDYTRLPTGEAAEDYYARQAQIQADAGAELIILEMMRDIRQTRFALEGTLKVGLPVWVGFSCYVGKDDEVCLLDTQIPLRKALNQINLEKAHAVGIMHTLVEHTPAAIDVLLPAWNGKTFAYPHAGRFDMPNWIFQDIMSPAEFANQGVALHKKGIDAVGGCCGITPAHIQELNARLAPHE